jgi:DNA-binding response OmpR family regulator
LSRRLRKIRPAVPILIATGYSTEVAEQKVLGEGINAYVGKPYHLSVMARTVREVLDAALRERDGAMISQSASDQKK